MIVTIRQDVLVEGWQPVAEACRRIAVCAAVPNPMLGSRHDAPMDRAIALAERLGKNLAARALAAPDGLPPRAYSKAAIVGLAGDHEHARDCDAMDTMTVLVPNALRPDEILPIVAYLGGPRPNTRVIGADPQAVAELIAGLEGRL